MDHAIDRLGGPAAVARMVGCKAPSVIEWRRRGIPADRCPALELGSKGTVTCEQMRPDVTWYRVPDVAWPHPEGRPLIDVGAAAAARQPTEPETAPGALAEAER